MKQPNWTLLTPLLDRPFAEISPIEHGIMWIGAYELKHCLMCHGAWCERMR